MSPLRGSARGSHEIEKYWDDSSVWQDHDRTFLLWRELLWRTAQHHHKVSVFCAARFGALWAPSSTSRSLLIFPSVVVLPASNTSSICSHLPTTRHHVGAAFHLSSSTPPCSCVENAMARGHPHVSMGHHISRPGWAGGGCAQQPVIHRITSPSCCLCRWHGGKRRRR